MTTQTLFTCLSACFELVGLSFVVFEISRAQRQAREVVDIETTVPNTIRVGAALEGSYALGSAQELSLEERVDLLERTQREHRGKLMREIESVRGELRQDVDRVRNEGLKTTVERDAALRDFISQQLGAGIGLRAIGAVLIAIGIALSVPANLA